LQWWKLSVVWRFSWALPSDLTMVMCNKDFACWIGSSS
jgi:hypothetical protein